jgi:hypothetical protein
MIDNNLYIVNSKVLSKYAKKQLRHGLYYVDFDDNKNIKSMKYENMPEIESWGLAEMVEDYGDKLKVAVYRFKVNGCAEFISYEIIDKKDYVCLNWPMCKYLYNTQGRFYNRVIIDYIEYLRIYNHALIGDFFDPNKEIFVYRHGEISPIKKFDYENGDYILPYTDWLIKQVETGEIDLDKALTERHTKPRNYYGF